MVNKMSITADKKPNNMSKWYSRIIILFFARITATDALFCQRLCKRYQQIKFIQSICRCATTIKKCFTTSDELRDAVVRYYDATDSKPTLVAQYGTINSWCVDRITDFSFIFSEVNFNDDISRWNTSSATNMNAMFLDAKSFNQDISSWNVASVTNMGSMFAFAESFNQDISSWKVSSVQDMSGMFEGAESFNQDLSPWNVANVVSMSFMFKDAKAYNKNLCVWKNMQDCTSFFPPTSMFKGTSCPTQDDPACGLGPFCQNC